MAHNTTGWAQTVPSPETLTVYATVEPILIPQTLAIHGPGDCPEAAASLLSTFIPLHCSVSATPDTADITISVSGNPFSDAALREFRTDDETWNFDCSVTESRV